MSFSRLSYKTLLAVAAALLLGPSLGVAGTTSQSFQVTALTEITKPLSTGMYNAKYTLSGAPDGMTVDPNTGVLYWTPTSSQVGGYTVTLQESDGSQTNTQVLTITVVAGQPLNLSQAYFVSPKGSNSTGDGSWAKPYFDTTPLCPVNGAQQTIAAGSTIYYRGGTYRNPGYGSGGFNNASMKAIACQGTANNKIVVRPWGNERAKIEFDGFIGVEITGQFLIFKGFEVQGAAYKMTSAQAMNDWWIGSRYFNGNGIVVKGAGVEVRDNIIHGAPGAAINTSPEADLVVVDNNILFNSSWWSTKGTSAIGFVGVNNDNAARATASASARITATNNLAFANESRVPSRVFSKGFANLTIDEGTAILVKQDGGNYDRGYTVKNNFFIYNGKGASLRAPDIEFSNNTMYDNGSTIYTTGAGLRPAYDDLNQGIRLTAKNNAIQVTNGKDALLVDPTVTFSNCSGNIFSGGSFKKAGICGDTSLNSLWSATAAVFPNPAALNFTRTDGIGADNEVLTAHKAKLASYGYSIQATGYVPDYTSLRQKVLDTVPQPSTTSKLADNLYRVTFPDTTNVTGLQTFDLKWD